MVGFARRQAAGVERGEESLSLYDARSRTRYASRVTRSGQSSSRHAAQQGRDDTLFAVTLNRGISGVGSLMLSSRGFDGSGGPTGHTATIQGLPSIPVRTALGATDW